MKILEIFYLIQVYSNLHIIEYSKLINILLTVFIILDRVLLKKSQHVAQASLDTFVSAVHVLRVQMCTTMPDYWLFMKAP